MCISTLMWRLRAVSTKLSAAAMSPGTLRASQRMKYRVIFSFSERYLGAPNIAAFWSAMPTRTLVRASATAGTAAIARTARIMSVLSRRICLETGIPPEGCPLGCSSNMRAAVFDGPGRPLTVRQVTDPPAPGPGQVRLEVGACGVCRTDLHLLDGEVDVPCPPRVLGHQIVGRV